MQRAVLLEGYEVYDSQRLRSVAGERVLLKNCWVSVVEADVLVAFDSYLERATARRSAYLCECVAITLSAGELELKRSLALSVRCDRAGGEEACVGVLRCPRGRLRRSLVASSHVG